MDIKNLLYSNSHEVVPKRGSLLLADPMLEEEVFRRSVVMLLDVEPDDTHLGLILNHPTSLTLNDLMPDWKAGADIPVFCGGPVDASRLFMLHALGNRFSGAVEILPGIYVGGKIDEIMEYVENGGETEGKMRFYLGYSGWHKQQLSNEIAHHFWAVETNPVSVGLLQGEGNAFWRREVGRLGDTYRSWLLVPENPSEN